MRSGFHGHRGAAHLVNQNRVPIMSSFSPVAVHIMLAAEFFPFESFHAQHAKLLKLRRHCIRVNASAALEGIRTHALGLPRRQARLISSAHVRALYFAQDPSACLAAPTKLRMADVRDMQSYRPPCVLEYRCWRSCGGWCRMLFHCLASTRAR